MARREEGEGKRGGMFVGVSQEGEGVRKRREARVGWPARLEVSMVVSCSLAVLSRQPERLQRRVV